MGLYQLLSEELGRAAEPQKGSLGLIGKAELFRK